MPLRHGLIAFLAIGSALSSQESRPADPGNPFPIEYFRTLDAAREPYQRATDLVASLQVSPGDWVADVGAGGGYYSMRLADLAGPEGKVIAEDISDSPLRSLSARVKTFDLRTVEAVKGDADDPKLPADQLKLHEIAPALVRVEVEQAGFQVVKVEDPFVKWRPGVGNTRGSPTDLWLMIAVRPK